MHVKQGYFNWEDGMMLQSFWREFDLLKWSIFSSFFVVMLVFFNNPIRALETERPDFFPIIPRINLGEIWRDRPEQMTQEIEKYTRDNEKHFKIRRARCLTVESKEDVCLKIINNPSTDERHLALAMLSLALQKSYQQKWRKTLFYTSNVEKILTPDTYGGFYIDFMKEAALWKGIAYYYLKNDSEALNYFHKAKALDKTDLTSNYWISRAYLRLSEFSLMKNYIDGLQSSELQKKCTLVKLLTAEYFFQQKKINQARQIIDDSLALLEDKSIEDNLSLCLSAGIYDVDMSVAAQKKSFQFLLNQLSKIETGKKRIEIITKHTPEEYSTNSFKAVTAIAESSIVAALDNNNSTIKFFDVKTSQLFKIIPIGKDSHNSLAVSINADLIALGGYFDRKVRLLSLSTGKDIITLNMPSDRVAFSQDGKFIAGIGNKKAEIREVSTGKVIRVLKTNSIGLQGCKQISFINLDQKLVGVCLGGFKVWDVKTGKLLVHKKFKRHRRHTIVSKLLYSAAVSPDGNWLITGFGDRTARLWSLRTGNLIKKIKTKGYSVLVTSTGKKYVSKNIGEKEIVSVSFSPDGKHFILIDHVISIYKTKSAKLIKKLHFSNISAMPMVFSDGQHKLMVTFDNGQLISYDYNLGYQKYNVAKREEVKTIDTPTLSLVPDNKDELVIGYKSGQALRLKFSNQLTSRQIHSPDEQPILGITDVAYSLEAQELAFTTFKGIISDKKGIIKRLEKNWEYKYQLEGNISNYINEGKNYWLVTAKEFSQTNNNTWGKEIGRSLFQWSGNESPEVVIPQIGQLKDGKLDSCYTGIQEIDVSKNGKLLAAIFWGGGGWCFGPLQVYDIPTGKLLLDIPLKDTRGINAFALSEKRANWLAYSFYDGDKKGHVIKVVNPYRKALIREIPLPDLSLGLNKMVFSPDASVIVASSKTDDPKKQMRVYGVETGKLLKTFGVHLGGAKHLHYSSDGRYLISTGEDQTVRVWDGKTYELLLTFVVSTTGEWVAITPEGFFDASEKGSQLLSASHGLTRIGIERFEAALYRPDLVIEKLRGDRKGRVAKAAEKVNLLTVFNSGKAPIIKIISPRTNVDLSDDNVIVDARLERQDGGFGKVEWRVNGVTLGVEELSNKTSDKAVMTLRKPIRLSPGRNVIEVVAYNKRHLVSSRTDKIEITFTSKSQQQNPRLHIFAVGVNNYTDKRLKLKYARSDAEAFAAKLKLKAGGIFDDVVLHIAYDEDVTFEKLGSIFDELKQSVRPEDVFVFFLAGHGITSEGTYYFLPPYFDPNKEAALKIQGIGQSQWQKWFSGIQSRKSLLIYDTCESGSLTDDSFAYEKLKQSVATERLKRALGRSILSATSGEDPALEGYKGHGVFTYAILEALTKGDKNNNGNVELTELAKHLDQRVPEISFDKFKLKQFPHLKIIGSDFIVSKIDELSPKP